MLRMPPPRRLLPLLAPVWALLASCAVGPDYQRPDTPTEAGLTAAPLRASADGGAGRFGASQRFVTGGDLAGDWWHVLHNPSLDALIEQALARHPDIQAGRSALDAARELALAQRGASWPTASAGIAASRNRSSAAVSPTPASGALAFGLITPQVTVGFVPDVWGQNRRAVEALDAQTEQARFQLVATHIALSANIASTAITLAGLRAQLAAAETQVILAQQALDVVRQQTARGYATRLDEATQEAQLAQARTAIPPLQRQIDQARDQLAVLCGVFPNQDPAPQWELDTFTLPSELPVSVPSALVAQRPDVRQAEAALHAACARVGVAVANRLPALTLTGDLGITALTPAGVFRASDAMWSVGAGVVQPIFAGGALRHQERAARAAYLQADAQYRSVVLSAFQNVADALHALVTDADALGSASAAAEAARTTVEMTRAQLEAGEVNILALVVAEQTYQQAVQGLVQARANRLLDSVALYLALGGGWWHRPDLPHP